jgi:hypothetical protein
MNNTPKLRICPAYPLNIHYVEEPQYEIYSLDAKQLSGHNLDYAVGEAVLKNGILYLYFSVGGSLDSVSYAPHGGTKSRWSPTSDVELSRRILKEYGYTEGNEVEKLRELVATTRGGLVELLRLRGNNAC